MKQRWMKSRLAIAMGGRVAEELKFGLDNVTSGASSDIDGATRLAKAMVTRWGLSEKLGTVAYGDNQEEVFLGMSMGRQQNVSEATAQTIDAEVRRLVDEGYQEAKRILIEKNADFEALSQGLLEYETLSGEEIKQLLLGNPPKRGDDAPQPPRSSAVPSAGKHKPTGPAGGLEPQPQA